MYWNAQLTTRKCMVLRLIETWDVLKYQKELPSGVVCNGLIETWDVLKFACRLPNARAQSD